MGYYLDLEKISIDEYQKMLKTRYLIPSMRVLLENIDNNFDKLRKSEITNMQELKTKLKNKKSMAALHTDSGIDSEYLNILRREVNSHHSPPRNIVDYPSIADDVKEKLLSLGIKTSIELYDSVMTKEDRNRLRQKLDTDIDTINHLAALADVTRLRYVSSVFASLLVLSGYESIAKIKEADPEKMQADIAGTNEQKQLFKGKLGLNDMRFLIQDTEYVACDIVNY